MSKLSVIMTINNRPKDVCQQVAESFTLPGNHPDEMVIVLDRPTEEAKAAAYEHFGPLDARFVTIPGTPGWICPAKAWNSGFAAATGDLFYLISSEVVQDAGNIDKAKKVLGRESAAVFGACHNSVPDNLVMGAEPGLLVSSKLPRPLGFIVCLPALNIKQIGGMDEEFMRGYWYDDDDLFYRVWNTGLDFIFDDSIHGIHLHHERPVLASQGGQEGISKNAAYILSKHGTHHPLNNIQARVEQYSGKTIWRNPQPAHLRN